MASTQKPLQSAAFLLKKLSDKSINASRLTTHQRRICVRYMLHRQEWSIVEIAEILQVHRMTIARDKKLIREQNSYLLDDVDERKIATDMLEKAEIASARLFRKGRERDAWTVQKECVEMLQSLGYIRKKPVEVEGTFSLLDLLNKHAGNGHTTNQITESDQAFLEQSP